MAESIESKLVSKALETAKKELKLVVNNDAF
jgi:hypothetical protein